MVAHVERALGIVHIRRDELRVLDAAILQYLLHHIHDNNALRPRDTVALLLAVAEAAGTLVGFPEHAVAKVALGVLGDGAVDNFDFVGAREDDLVLKRAESRAHDLDLALGALDADRGTGGVLAIGVGGYLDGCHGNAHAAVLRKVADNARRLISSGVVLINGGDNGGSLLVSFGLNMVQRLEHPSQGVDAQIQQSATSQFEVDHTVRVREPNCAVVLALSK